jgi:16S rRNA processing protein RimM
MEPHTHTSSAGRLIALGEIVATHGVRGLVRFRPYGSTTSPLPTGRPVYLTAAPRPGEHTEPEEARSIVLTDAHVHGKVLLLRVDGIDTIETAAPLIGHALAIPESDLPAPEPGEFYVFQLEGLDVVTNHGDRVGTIDGSFSTGASEVLVVRDGGREYLIPVIADVVRSIDVPGGRVVIEPIEGLLDS